MATSLSRGLGSLSICALGHSCHSCCDASVLQLADLLEEGMQLKRKRTVCAFISSCRGEDLTKDKVSPCPLQPTKLVLLP